MRRLKIGIAGMRRGVCYAQIFSLRPECEVVAVCDVNLERAKQTAKTFDCQALSDYTEMCQLDLDAIVVVTPVPTHYECSFQALQAGKHVLCEIPVVSDLKQAEGLLKKVRETGLVYMAAENVCYLPAIQKMHQLVQAGTIGEVFYAEGEYIHDCRNLLFQRDDGLGGGTESRPSWRAALEPICYSTHELGPLLMVLDDYVVKAIGLETTRQANCLSEKVNVQAALFQTAKGRLIRQVTAFFITRQPAHHFYSLYGTSGCIETDRYQWAENLKVYSKESGQQELRDVQISLCHEGTTPEQAAGGHGTCEYFLIEEFVKAIGENRSPFLDIYRSLEMTVPGICAVQSIRQGGQVVPVPTYR
ncbi:MAG: Gfo/Idh/MocA family oxidoreductase [Candidatus Omnitrophica bacterium]|nr:Gfo/Idh/MocA family oxidoreductase [Candidatus Omnitrophota bacterium]